MQLLDPDKTLEIPPEIAVCPYCGTKLTANFTGWTQNDDGSWSADSMDLVCETGPDIDSEDWDFWFESHSDLPYVYLLPVEERIKAWLNERYRFDLPNEGVAHS